MTTESTYRRFQFSPQLMRWANLYQMDELAQRDGDGCIVITFPNQDRFQVVSFGDGERIEVHNSELVPTDEEFAFHSEGEQPKKGR